MNIKITFVILNRILQLTLTAMEVIAIFKINTNKVIQKFLPA